MCVRNQRAACAHVHDVESVYEGAHLRSGMYGFGCASVSVGVRTGRVPVCLFAGASRWAGPGVRRRRTEHAFQLSRMTRVRTRMATSMHGPCTLSADLVHAPALHNKPGACAQGEAALKTTGSLPFSGACARRPGYNAETHTPWLGTTGHFRNYHRGCSPTKGMNGGTSIAPGVQS